MIKYPGGIIKKTNMEKSKYGNKKTTYKGIKFDSKGECERYKELKLLENIGKIEELKTQVKFKLQPSYKIGNKTIRAITYVADFTYYSIKKKNGIEFRDFIVEDFKGYKTPVYRIKKKMFEYKYGVEIKET